MDKKYQLTNETREIDGHTLYRIKALRDFGDIKAGDLGGFIESKRNLSHKGNCWVADNACVFDRAWVCGDAVITGYALVTGEALVSGNAQVSGDACVSGKAHVTGNAQVSGNTYFLGNAQVSSYADICKDTVITGE
ncbi:hypothetical protein [Bartonella sp. DGB2]|uniref:hypothetical protein n=1 Tax=Bartonella sp. DGB2 TaxID=3388426 RepID=UPI00398F9C18